MLSMEQAQARQPRSPMRAEQAAPMPSPQLLSAHEDCMTSPQAVMMSASPDDTWQPGRLREVMQVQHRFWTSVHPHLRCCIPEECDEERAEGSAKSVYCSVSPPSSIIEQRLGGCQSERTSGRVAR